MDAPDGRSDGTTEGARVRRRFAWPWAHAVVLRPFQGTRKAGPVCGRGRGSVAPAASFRRAPGSPWVLWDGDGPRRRDRADGRRSYGGPGREPKAVPRGRGARRDRKGGG